MEVLIIVDPQNDFIKGSLAVPGAEEAMNNLVKFLENNTEEIYEVVVTLDNHPLNHCSFKERGGDWPIHCVKYSEGAAIYNPLYKLLIEYIMDIIVLEKGTYSHKEEYSAFSKYKNPKIFDNYKDSTIYIAGLAGDFCVLNTVKDLVRLGFKNQLVILLDGIASIDGGKALQEYIETEDLEYLGTLK